QGLHGFWEDHYWILHSCLHGVRPPWSQMLNSLRHYLDGAQQENVTGKEKSTENESDKLLDDDRNTRAGIAGGRSCRTGALPAYGGGDGTSWLSHFVMIIGAWKVLGGVALLVPRLPQLKEWAYAGIFFNMTGAAISHAVCTTRLGMS